MAPIPDDVRRFILNSIPSIPCLEALLLLHENPNRSWGITELASRLFINPKLTEEILEKLAAAKVISVDPKIKAYHFDPNATDLKKILDQLAITYKENLIEVTNLIHSITNKKATNFANAFIWHKDK